MTDEEFFAIALDARSKPDDVPGWWLSGIEIDLNVPPKRCRIRLMGYNHDHPTPRAHMCFAFADRTAPNAAELLARLIVLLGEK